MVFSVPFVGLNKASVKSAKTNHFSECTMISS